MLTSESPRPLMLSANAVVASAVDIGGGILSSRVQVIGNPSQTMDIGSRPVGPAERAPSAYWPHSGGLAGCVRRGRLAGCVRRGRNFAGCRVRRGRLAGCVRRGRFAGIRAGIPGPLVLLDERLELADQGAGRRAHQRQRLAGRPEQEREHLSDQDLAAGELGDVLDPCSGPTTTPSTALPP